jgi:chemotaxis protein MotB
MGGRAKKEDPPPPGLPAWLATFSDMVTLLLTFFILLMGMANFDDTAKVDAVMESISNAFGVGGFDEALLGTAVGENLTDSIRVEEAVHPIVARLRQAMAQHVSDELARVSAQPNEVRLRLDDRVFFRPGSTTLHPSAYGLIGDLAALAKDFDTELVVEGHSDATGDSQSNWELSALRAVAVVRALETRGVEGSKLVATAYGATRPASTFAEDDSWNRRIEFVIRTDDATAAAAARGLEQEVGDGR